MVWSAHFFNERGVIRHWVEACNFTVYFYCVIYRNVFMPEICFSILIISLCFTCLEVEIILKAFFHLKSCEKFKQLTEGNSLPAVNLVLESQVKSKSQKRKKKIGHEFQGGSFIATT